MTLPIIMTKEGAQPRTATELRSTLVAKVAETNAGYTANLPGSLIEDIASTDVAAIAMCDSAFVELINSLTPRGANEFLLNQLGQIYGISKASSSNTSVYVDFIGVQGFVIIKGFTVSDGTHQYVAKDGGIIGTLGTATLYFEATVAGSWAVPANTVNQIVTSVPASIGLSCDNANAGTMGGETETTENYRSRVLQAGIASAQGMATFLRTLLNNVAGVQSRLIGIKQSGSDWKIIVGGGDPYEVGYAIYQALFNINDLVGSSTTSRNITVTINDYPDKYNIVFVVPPAQSVIVQLTWNTTLTNYIDDSSISVLGGQAISNYINNIYAGEAINIYEMQAVFQDAVGAIIPPQYLSKMDFIVSIDSVIVPPTSGTGLVEGDSEGYFYTTLRNILITRG